VRVAIATTQVPFLSGGAEALASGLREALARRGHEAEIVTLPFRFFPAEEVSRGMRAWEAEDFMRLNLYEPHHVICLKFPAYGLAHPKKSLWLCHQHRAAYDLFDAARAGDVDRALRDDVAAFDARHLAEVSPRRTISKRVSERLRAATGIESAPLYHPPPDAELLYCERAQPYVFFPSRVEDAKRQELLVRAMSLTHAPVHAVFAGLGGQLDAMHKLAASLHVDSRVRFLGHVSREEKLALYAHCAMVFFGPRDEDYGYVTLEAMLSSKPVVTCRDSGGPLEFVSDGETGLVCEPDPLEVARAIESLAAAPERAARMGRAGRERAAALLPSWDAVVDALLATGDGGRAP